MIFVLEDIPQYYKVDPLNDIQVLAPMQRGNTGAQNLNRILQKSLNKNTKGLEWEEMYITPGIK
jgi:exodeoxyribonuclease V alpha subunit